MPKTTRSSPQLTTWLKAEFFVQHGKVRYVDTPMKSPVIDVHLFWHQRFQKDPAHVWLRQQIHALFRQA